MIYYYLTFIILIIVCVTKVIYTIWRLEWQWLFIPDFHLITCATHYKSRIFLRMDTGIVYKEYILFFLFFEIANFSIIKFSNALFNSYKLNTRALCQFNHWLSKVFNIIILNLFNYVSILVYDTLWRSTCNCVVMYHFTESLFHIHYMFFKFL